MRDEAAASRAALNPATLAIASIFAFVVLVQGISAPFQKDAEPQSAQWIQSIVRDGHWLIPHDAYGYTDRKPPLFYWLSACVSKVSGGSVDEVRARTVSVVSGTALAVAVLAWTAANVGVSEGWLAFLLMLGTYGFASRATTALTDMLLTFLLFAAYSAIYPLLGARPSQSPASRRGALVGVILGLGVLTKGPVAIVLCGLAAAIYLLIERRNPVAMLRERWPWQALAIAIAIGAFWYVPALIVGGHKIVRIVVAENFGHFMPVKFGGTGESSRPFYFIAARLLGGAFPMTLLIPPAALAFYTGEIASEKRRAVIYQVSMSIAVLVFFSIASVKRDDYILPAIPGIAILCASVFTLATRGAASKLRDVIIVVFALGSIAVIASLFLFPSLAAQLKLHSSDEAYYAVFLTMGASLALFVLCYVVLDVAAIFAVLRRRAIYIGAAFGLLGLCQSLLWTARLRPGLAYARSVKSFVPTVNDRVKGDQLCIASGINYELSYYYDVAIPELRNPKCAYLFATPREVDAMTPEDRARLRLVAKSNLIGGGGPPALYQIAQGAAK
ncbi:MAG TPA: phospholipid carrier-dependent glycosyltransferase [Patescibacteria group bacterium]|nr:phospholipid carrier-dependent glycosyltransferase [Patescibacteria group bacterium]